MIVTRFAPSPTGYLHLGHAFAAITARDTANAAGGKFLVRIEDIDTTRCRAEFETAIFEDLSWLGSAWETPVLRQSTRFDVYRSVLDTLDQKGLLYPCFCTRAEITAELAQAIEAPHGPEGALYPGTCRHLDAATRAAKIASGAPYSLRLDVEKIAALVGPLTFEEYGAGPNGKTGTITVNPHLFGDIVLARKETPASYHLAVVVDDAFQNVSLVTRGNDLFSATHIQRVLQTILGFPTPAYAHHKLILDRSGKKFSKRDSTVTLRSLRERGVTAEEIRPMIGL
ncbi:MAG TPA: tRNA glutamyl-Q(34) synthetase GluQRS [Rhizomicrobium sp.]|nr:tRNA glutamyl-Q(34) synthetase GluQRS [Rhizomicrobium sp.]